MPAFHEPSISFKNQMHKREDWGSQLICLPKIKGLQRGKEVIWKWGCQEIWMGPQQRDTCSRWVGQNEHSWQQSLPPQHNAFPIVSNIQILILFLFQLIFYCAFEYAAQKGKLNCQVLHTHFFSKQSRMPNQQKALTLFSQVINLNGKPAYCDSITKELLHSGAAGIISINWFERIQLRLYHNIQSCISPVFTGLPHIT